MVRYLQVDAVRPGETDWRTKVLVLEKWNVVKTGNGKRLQKLILTDDKGNKVLGLYWNHIIDLHRNNLQPFQTYMIGGATVAPIKDEYLKNTPGITIQWTITRPTYVCLAKQEEMPITYPHIPLMTCADMISTIGSPNKISMLVVLLDIKQPREVEVEGKPRMLQECIVIHQELRPIVLTLWGTYMDIQGAVLTARKHEHPIILAKNLLGRRFSGISLTTSSSTFLAVDPDIPQAKELRVWFEEHKETATGISTSSTRRALQKHVPYDPQQPITPVAKISPGTKNPWIEVRIQIDRISQTITYGACPECMHAVSAEPGEDYHCPSCDCDVKIALKCRLNAEAKDSSGTASITLFDSLAEKMLGATAEELHKMDRKATEKLLSDTDVKMMGTVFLAEIRAPYKKQAGQTSNHIVEQIEERSKENEASGSANSSMEKRNEVQAPDTPAKKMKTQVSDE